MLFLVTSRTSQSTRGRLLLQALSYYTPLILPNDTCTCAYITVHVYVFLFVFVITCMRCYSNSCYLLLLKEFDYLSILHFWYALINCYRMDYVVDLNNVNFQILSVNIPLDNAYMYIQAVMHVLFLT